VVQKWLQQWEKNGTDVFSLESEYSSALKKKFYHVEFDREIKGDINPYKLKTGIENIFKEKVEKLTTDSQNVFFFPDKDYRKHATFRRDITLRSASKWKKSKCKISPYKYLNHIKGILYIYEYEFNEEFKEDLMNEYHFIEDVTEAPFMKPRNQQATALLLTFRLDTLPYSLYIPGERADSVVYQYHDRPMICHSCYKYGHTKARCNQAKVCRKCGGTDHSIDNCQKQFQVS